MRLKSLKLSLAFVLALVPVVTLSGTAQAAPDHTITLAAGSQSWSGAAADGANDSYNSAAGTPCPETPSGPSDYCEQTLLHMVPGAPSNVEVSLADDPAQDFDLYIYNSDATATRGTLVDSSANPQTLLEVAVISSAPDDSYYLIQVVYFQTFAALGGYDATAEITGGGEPPPPPAPDLPQTVYYLHEDGPPPPPADPGTFDTTAPTAQNASVAASSASSPVQPQWTGNIGTAPGTLRRFKVAFWQNAPAETGNVDYEITLIVGTRRYEFPFFTEPFGPGIPSLVTHQFEAAPMPIVLPGGPVTFEIAGHFIDTQSTTQIFYDSVNNASHFVVNPPAVVLRSPIPPDVDSPPGLQEILASNPALGFRSRSEMHIAQNPLNPNYLVAASKFYNKDPDSLAQYEFKIGTYITFDRGRTWTDLGQTNVCPADDPGAQNWPNNTCYPEDDPAANDDVGEQYITSDPWVGWDDEGNAYLMVLDSPPFPTTGNGWGMTLHRWDSVSASDIPNNTWGPRLVISSYDTSQEQQLFLDDKNTFAVNNAGPDKDGQTGSIVACWGKNIPTAQKQAEVCKQSTDKGQTWSPEVPINDVEQLGIGVNVIADPFDANTFYATYLQYLSGVVGPSTMEFNKSVDGGLTWLPVSTTVATLDDLETRFPGQTFRNLSIPIMAAGRRVGTPPMTELYITWAEDRLVGGGPDKEAEIVIVRSDNGGATWNGLGIPPNHVKVVNGPDNDRDQFQPFVAVTPLGQVNVMYFDRRHDTDNYYVDTYLSRSMDRGLTFSDHRLSHDATDPEYNAPRDAAGNAFFGDYQGLAVDNCFAYPFVNDTHLANDAFLDPGPGPRDPDYDFNMPDSPYQEAISWRVPNIAAFGGDAVQCPTSRKRSIPH
ncbi:MAG TPA: sialidase family protein [Actinomycetota bacterium]|nr:sialidase family protein [Actinomycetota bacterium]